MPPSACVTTNRPHLLVAVLPKRTTGKRGPAPKIQQQLERITQLPKPKQKFVMEMLDIILQQQGR